VANGVVYVGSKDNYVYAISAATGHQAWKTQVGWVLLSPEVVSGMVCVATDSGEFSALRASSGVPAWQVRTGVPAAFSRPWAVSGGNVILCTAGPLQAYDVATGGQGRSYGAQDQFYRAVGAADGAIYAVDGSGNMNAFSTGSGASLWNKAVVTDGGVPNTSVVVAGGAVYVGTTNGTLYSVDAATGHPNWSYPTGNELESSPVAVDGIVYLSDTSGKLHAITTSSGKLAWQHTSSPGIGGPAVANGKVYAATSLALQELDAKSGDAGWSYSPPDYGAFVSTPTVAGGLVFVGCTDDSLYAVRT
jgi:outer membrane protein assembly factor BamB